MKKTLFSDAEYYKNYSYKKLNGRYLHLPSKSSKAKRTFVILYGQHATLERIEPVIKALTRFGDVYAVDNPGFGGMDPSFKIRQYPDLSFYAGHLKNFIDNYVPSDRKITLLGISFGFQIALKTLREYPELKSRTENIISFVGFVHPSDFHIPPSYYYPLVFVLGNLTKSWLGSNIVKLFMNEPVILFIYKVTRPIQVKLKDMPKKEAFKYAREQAWLWRVNDVRTHSVTALDFIHKNDLTSFKIEVPALHVGVPKDHLINNAQIVNELQKIFDDLTPYDLQLENHAPLDLDSSDKVLNLLPLGMRSKLKSSNNEKAVMS